MQLFQQSEATAAQRRLFFHAVDATDGITAETGLSGTGRISKNGAATAASTATITQIDATNMPGRYFIEFTATELDTVGIIEFRFKAAACAEVVARGQVVPWDPYDTVRQGMTALPNAAAEAAGGLYTRGSGAGQINQQTNGQIDANVARWLNVVVNALIAGRVDANAQAGIAPLGTAMRGTDGAATPAQVNTEVSDVLKVDTVTLPGQVAPPATPTFEEILGHLYKAYRNRKRQTATIWELMNDAEAVVDQKATVSDDGTTAIKQEIVSGP